MAYRWRKSLVGMNISDVLQLKQLLKENFQLKRVVAVFLAQMEPTTRNWRRDYNHVRQLKLPGGVRPNDRDKQLANGMLNSDFLI